MAQVGQKCMVHRLGEAIVGCIGKLFIFFTNIPTYANNYIWTYKCVCNKLRIQNL